MPKSLIFPSFLLLFFLCPLTLCQEKGDFLKGYEDYSPPPSLGAPYGMIKIPEGSFYLGNVQEKIDYLVKERFQKTAFSKQFETELINKAEQKRTLPAFYIDMVPVTNLQYERFLKAMAWPAPRIDNPEIKKEEKERLNWEKGTFPKGKGKHPVVAVSWDDADAFARWAGKRLPTEEQWEKAARGDKDDRIWPWGDFWDDFEKARLEKISRDKWKDYERDNYCACGERGLTETVPVGQFPKGASPYGVLDLMGNVWEWTSSWARPYPGGKPSLFDERKRVLKGGSWGDMKFAARCATRAFVLPEWKTDGIGFRCVRSAITGEDPVWRFIQEKKYLLKGDCSFNTSKTAGIENTQTDREANVVKGVKVLAACARESLSNVIVNALEAEGKKEPVLMAALHTSVRIMDPPLLPGDYFIFYQGPSEEGPKKEEAPEPEKKEEKKEKKKAQKEVKEEEQEAEKVKEEKQEEKGLPKTTRIPRLFFMDGNSVIVGEIRNPVLFNDNNVESSLMISSDKENLLFKLSIPALYGAKRLVFLVPLKKVDEGLTGYLQ